MEQRTLFTEKKTKGRKSTKLRQTSISEKEKVCQQNLGLVVDIAKEYVDISPDFSLKDLISEGILGLFRAAEKFDDQKGFKFSTYAVWWIKQSISKALNERGRTIHIPGHIIEGLSKYTKVRKKLFQELGQEPLIEEMAAAMKITIFRAQQIRKFLENPSKIISLERPLGEDGNSTLSEFIEDPKVISPVAEDLKKTLGETLTPREEKIIKLRFGLEDNIDHSLKEIGRAMGLSRQRIQQIIKRALAKLRRDES